MWWICWCMIMYWLWLINKLLVLILMLFFSCFLFFSNVISDVLVLVKCMCRWLMEMEIFLIFLIKWYCIGLWYSLIFGFSECLFSWVCVILRGFFLFVMVCLRFCMLFFIDVILFMILNENGKLIELIWVLLKFLVLRNYCC